MNGFIVQAVPEKVAMRRAFEDLTPEEQSSYLEGRAACSSEDRLAELIKKAGTTDEARPGDEVPEGWLPTAPKGE